VLERRVHEELAALRWQEVAGTPVAQAAIEAAAAEFRYARGLVSADEMRAWLDGWGLSAREWMDWVRRDHARTMAARTIDEVTAQHSPAPGELVAALPITFVCSELADRFGRDLAERAAVHAVEGLNDRAVECSHVETADALELLSAFGALSVERVRERIAVIGQFDDALAPFRHAALTPAAVRRELDARRLDWIRVDYRTVIFASEHAAREASWCVRRDGLDLDEVVARAGAILRTDRSYLCDVDGALRTGLLGARAGELIGPTRENGCFVLHYVDFKELPSLDDPEMRRRVEDHVLQKALASVVHDHVRWQVAL
jgi:hypothetical protein